jgi:hypothetical protein
MIKINELLPIPPGVGKVYTGPSSTITPPSAAGGEVSPKQLERAGDVASKPR